jgi:hypothetical protein
MNNPLFGAAVADHVPATVAARRRPIGKLNEWPRGGKYHNIGALDRPCARQPTIGSGERAGPKWDGAEQGCDGDAAVRFGAR